MITFDPTKCSRNSTQSKKLALVDYMAKREAFDHSMMELFLLLIASIRGLPR